MSTSKKIVLIGHFGVGKTSLMRRFVDNAFSEDYKVTLGVQVKKKMITLANGDEISFIIWDLEGNTSVEKTRKSYMLGANAFIYVFDATRTETFKDLNSEVGFLQEHYPSAKTKVIGNKMDLVNVESLNDIMRAKTLKYDFLTSAKTGDNVESMFKELAIELLG
jgi:small GTP-binding protein